MPPFTPNTSRAQQRKVFALAGHGAISMTDAKGKARASDYAHLPEHKKQTHANHATRGLHKALRHGRT